MQIEKVNKVAFKMFKRLKIEDEGSLAFTLDGIELSGQVGDTVLTAVLACRDWLSQASHIEPSRAGFCLMGACQGCWLWEAEGKPVRACTHTLYPGLELRSHRPEGGRHDR